MIPGDHRYDDSCVPSSSFSHIEKDGLYKAIFSRRDVRSHFVTDKNIPNEILFRILNAAHHAPSVGFSQPWNFILINESTGWLSRLEVSKVISYDRWNNSVS